MSETEPTRFETDAELIEEVKRHVEVHRAKCPASTKGIVHPCPCRITKALICDACDEIICVTALVQCEHFERAATSKTAADLYKPHLRIVK